MGEREKPAKKERKLADAVNLTAQLQRARVAATGTHGSSR